MDKVKIAVTHASSLLAEALLEKMAASGIRSESVILLDLEQQSGNRLSYGDTYLTVLDQHEYDYEDLTAVLLIEPDTELESLLQHADCYVISHYFDKTCSNIFTPEISPQSNLPDKPCAIKLASAELSSLAEVVKPFDDNYALISLNIVNVLSSSFYGKAGIDELASQTISLLSSQEINSSIFPFQLAFNMIPTEGCHEMEQQLQSVMQSNELKCSVQNILVPAFHGLAISVSLESTDKIDIEKLSVIFKNSPGIQLVELPVSPLTHCKSDSKILISGLHLPQQDSNRLQFWVIADSVRNGLIQNYLNMLEILLKSFL